MLTKPATANGPNVHNAAGEKLGVSEETITFEYDLLGRLIKETTPQGALDYEYDPLSNLTTLTLPTGQHLNHLYYGSGHLHQLNLDGLLISDIERDDLHREVYRSQGKLTSCFGYDAMGRKAWQFASTLPGEKLSQIHNPGDNSLLIDHAYNPIHRRYEYDPAGELTRTLDKLRGEIKYEYEANGQLHSRDTGRLVDSEEFRYDAAANRLNFNTSQFDQVKDNRIKRWRDQEYSYDAWGNLIEKRVGLSKLQTFSYDCENRLVKAETLVNGKLHSTGSYRYDSLGRRIGKTSDIDGRTEHKHFLWQGLRMLREETPWQSSLYVYEPSSYTLLARVDQQEGETEQKLYYFHTDQIGTPLEMTDVDGRIVTQDPIGLKGGTNLYQHVDNPILWLDPGGLRADKDWGAYYSRKTGTTPPSTMVRPHAHYIVFKGEFAKSPNDEKGFRTKPDSVGSLQDRPTARSCCNDVG